MKTWVASLLWHFGFSRIQKLPMDIFLNSIPEPTSWVCPLLCASALPKAGTEKRITVPALLYVIKIHKYHHITVWHHRCTAHSRNGDWGNVLPPLIHKSGSLQRRAALRYTPILLPLTAEVNDSTGQPWRTTGHAHWTAHGFVSHLSVS